jgi:hypothetical protein
MLSGCEGAIPLGQEFWANSGAAAAKTSNSLITGMVALSIENV